MTAVTVPDLVSVADFEREISRSLPAGELERIVTALELKAAATGELLAGELDQAALARLLGLAFTSRRRAGEIIEAIGPGRLAAGIRELLAPGEELAGRFERFSAMLDGFPDAGFELPGELLHFSDPGRYWLWSRWLWEPRTGTGALALVTGAGPAAAGTGRGAGYLAVGRATAAVARPGGPLATDAFLACVYGIYLRLVLRARMSAEFNQLLPALPDLARRLLGVYYQGI